jgi:hypothetical protein
VNFPNSCPRLLWYVHRVFSSSNVGGRYLPPTQVRRLDSSPLLTALEIDGLKLNFCNLGSQGYSKPCHVGRYRGEYRFHGREERPGSFFFLKSTFQLLNQMRLDLDHHISLNDRKQYLNIILLKIVYPILLLDTTRPFFHFPSLTLIFHSGRGRPSSRCYLKRYHVEAPVAFWRSLHGRLRRERNATIRSRGDDVVRQVCCRHGSSRWFLQHCLQHSRRYHLWNLETRIRPKDASESRFVRWPQACCCRLCSLWSLMHAGFLHRPGRPWIHLRSVCRRIYSHS